MLTRLGQKTAEQVILVHVLGDTSSGPCGPLYNGCWMKGGGDVDPTRLSKLPWHM